MELWDPCLTQRDMLVYQAAGYGRRTELGRRPAVVVIDATYEFTGLTREPILEAVKKLHTACGEEGWRAVDSAVPLLAAARGRGVPILYTQMAREGRGHPYAGKNGRWGESRECADRRFEIVAELAPHPGDVVISKLAPSAFQGTDLLYHLVRRKVDTLIFAGGTTSGCIRASVVEAFGYGFQVGIAAACVFDRFQASHLVSLFDMNAKYANVMTQAESLEYLNGL